MHRSHAAKGGGGGGRLSTVYASIYSVHVLCIADPEHTHVSVQYVCVPFRQKVAIQNLFAKNRGQFCKSFILPSFGNNLQAPHTHCLKGQTMWRSLFKGPDDVAFSC